MLQHVRLLDWKTHTELATLILPHAPGASFENEANHYSEWINHGQSRYKIRAVCEPNGPQSPCQPRPNTLDLYVEMVERSARIETQSNSIETYQPLSTRAKEKITTTVIFLDEQSPWSLFHPKDITHYANNHKMGFPIEFDSVPKVGDTINLEIPFPCYDDTRGSCLFFVCTVTHLVKPANLYTAVLVVLKNVNADQTARRPQLDDRQLAKLEQKIYQIPPELINMLSSKLPHPATLTLRNLILESPIVQIARRASTEAILRRASLRCIVPATDARNLFSYTHPASITDIRCSATDHFGVLTLHDNTYTIDVFKANQTIPKKHFSYTNTELDAQILAFAFTSDSKQ